MPRSSSPESITSNNTHGALTLLERTLSFFERHPVGTRDAILGAIGIAGSLISLEVASHVTTFGGSLVTAVTGEAVTITAVGVVGHKIAGPVTY